MANQMGKRYVCQQCGSEMLVTKPGGGTLTCCNQPMQLRSTPAPAATSLATESSEEVQRG